MNRKQGGFTLLELLVVMVIIGLLAAFVGPKYFKQIGKSQTQMARAQIEAFEKAVDQYSIDTGKFPTTEQGLAALYTQPASEGNWDGPYLKKGVPVDPWGKAYVYKYPSVTPGADYDLISYGRDGAAGGSGDNADITNHQ
jgi:general secretion pathway protein G